MRPAPAINEVVGCIRLLYGPPPTRLAHRPGPDPPWATGATRHCVPPPPPLLWGSGVRLRRSTAHLYCARPATMVQLELLYLLDLQALFGHGGSQSLRPRCGHRCNAQKTAMRMRWPKVGPPERRNGARSIRKGRHRGSELRPPGAVHACSHCRDGSNLHRSIRRKPQAVPSPATATQGFVGTRPCSVSVSSDGSRRAPTASVPLPVPPPPPFRRCRRWRTLTTAASA